MSCNTIKAQELYESRCVGSIIWFDLNISIFIHLLQRVKNELIRFYLPTNTLKLKG